MLYSLKKEAGQEKPKDKSKNKRNYDIIPTACSHTHTPIESTIPHLSDPPIIHNNNIMDKEVLVQMRQSNKCESVRMMKYSTYTLGIWCRPLSQHPLAPARHQPHLLIPSIQTINQKNPKNPEIDSPPNKSCRTSLIYVQRTQG